MAERALVWLRRLAAVVTAGVLGAIVWLIIVEEERFVPEALDFNHLLGELVLGPGHETARSDGPLALVGDPVAPTGFGVTCLFGVALAVLHMLVVEPALGRVPRMRRSLLLRALPVALIAYVLWGLVFTAVVQARLDVDAGPFGVDGSGATPVTYAVAAFLTGIVIVRAVELVRTAEWWRPKRVDHESALRDATGPR
jgi:hypothetical protein